MSRMNLGFNGKVTGWLCGNCIRVDAIDEAALARDVVGGYLSRAMELPAHVRTRCPVFGWMLLAAVVAVPVTLLWDYAWESTVGIDLVWSPPHAANYAAMAVAGLAAGMWIFVFTREAIPAVR